MNEKIYDWRGTAFLSNYLKIENNRLFYGGVRVWARLLNKQADYWRYALYSGDSKQGEIVVSAAEGERLYCEMCDGRGRFRNAGQLINCFRCRTSRYRVKNKTGVKTYGL